MDTGRVDVIIVSSNLRQAHVTAFFSKEPRGVPVLVIIRDGIPAWVTPVPVSGFLVEDELTLQSLSESLMKVGDWAEPASAASSSASDYSLASATLNGQNKPHLTARERDVLALLTEGLSIKEIAAVLKISLHGVKRLGGNVLAKLNCDNRTLAVSRAIRDGLLSPGRA